MKKNALLTLLLLAALAGTAAAGDRYEAGIMVGVPTGLSGKLNLSRTEAVDAGMGWAFSDDKEFYLHADKLWQRDDVFKPESGRMPLYFGVGGRVKTREGRASKLGVRLPVGVQYYLPQPNPGVTFFAEAAPILDMAPDTSFGLNVAIGVRFLF